MDLEGAARENFLQISPKPRKAKASRSLIHHEENELTDGNGDEAIIAQLTVKQLQVELKGKGLSAIGDKSALQKRLATSPPARTTPDSNTPTAKRARFDVTESDDTVSQKKDFSKTMDDFKNASPGTLSTMSVEELKYYLDLAGYPDYVYLGDAKEVQRTLTPTFILTLPQS